LKVDYSEESSVKKALHFEIEPEVVDKEIAERSKHYASRVKLPGFRPGKVPLTSSANASASRSWRTSRRRS
jgi:FKBP-type peptidyl-prolyl cis-trans isomerase (trigger factor)